MCCEVKSCCCCIPLRDSVFILGYLRLFFGLTEFVVASAALSSASTLAFLPKIILSRNPEEQLQLFAIISIGSMAHGMFISSTSLLLIVGGHKRKSLPIRAYFWISIPGLVMDFAYIVFLIVMSESQIMIPGLFTTLAIEIYFIVVSRSVYMEIDKEQVTTRHGQHVENPLTA